MAEYSFGGQVNEIGDNILSVQMTINNDMTGQFSYTDQYGSTLRFNMSAADYAKFNMNGADRIQINLNPID